MVFSLLNNTIQRDDMTIAITLYLHPFAMSNLVPLNPEENVSAVAFKF
jgi:hypothetical protein